MNEPLAHVKYTTHSVHVTRNADTGRIVCFKYNDTRCEFAVFEEIQYYKASDYVLEPLPEGSWGFVEDSD